MEFPFTINATRISPPAAAPFSTGNTGHIHEGILVHVNCKASLYSDLNRADIVNNWKKVAILYADHTASAA